MYSRNYWIETYGCQMNKAESNALRFKLNNNGFEEAQSCYDAQVVILNTCSVRKTAENRIWGRLGFYRTEKKKRNIILVVMGCMSQRLGQELRKIIPEVDIIVGSFQKKQLIAILKNFFHDNKKYNLIQKSEYCFADMHYCQGSKAYVPIMHGCNNYCSYCIVPYVRGKEVSRSPEKILTEIRQLDANNVRQITLLGQNVNSYYYSQNGYSLDFPMIMEKIASSVTNIEWIRFLTSHPKDISLRLIKLIASNPLFCNHIHLPVQHGSDKILSLMKRGYTREHIIALSDYIKKTISDVSLTTDILIGFPGETEKDFKLTLDLMKRIEFDDAFTYYYNSRPGTISYSMEDTVPYKLKIERLSQLINIQKQISQKKKKKYLGKTRKVIVETHSKKNNKELLARTEQDEMVVFAGAADLIGSFVNIKLESVKGSTYKGVLINN